MISEKPIDFDRFIRWVIWAAFAVGTFFLLRHLSGVLLPFLLAWLTAYLLNPVVVYAQKLLKNRVLSVLLTLLAFVSLGVLLVALMVPIVVDEFNHLYLLVSDQLRGVEWPAWLPRDVAERLKASIEGLEVSDLLGREGFADGVFSALTGLFNSLAKAYGLLQLAFSLVTYALYLVFIMIDYDRINAAWITYIPEKYKPRVKTLASDLEVGMNGYFRAQTKIVLVVSVLFAIGFKIIGLPFGVVLGLLVGLMNYVPYLQLAGMPPALFLAALNAWETGNSIWLALALVLVVFGVIQLLQDALITPKFLGDFSGFNPAIILLSLSIWGSLLGMVGLIIAIPMTSLLLNYYKRYLSKSSR